MPKNKKDLRYRKKDKAILEAIMDVVSKDDYAFSIKTGRICRIAKVSRSTFRRHYHYIGEVFQKKDQKMMSDFLEINFSDLDGREAWVKTMLFMKRNHEIFEFKFHRMDDRFFRRMVEHIVDEMDIPWERYQRIIVKRIFEMFYVDTVGLITIWIKEGMKTVDIEKKAKELTVLMQTADKRWIEFAK